MTVTRRQGREWALQMLCQADLNPTDDLDAAIENFWRQQWQIKEEAAQEVSRSPDTVIPEPPDFPELVAPKQIREFAESRVRGVLSALDDLDKSLAPHLDHWAMYRLGTVERNVLRLGAWELRNCPDIPAPVVINEAVDLAKYFSNAESGRFVNGVLDHLAREARPAPVVAKPSARKPSAKKAAPRKPAAKKV